MKKIKHNAHTGGIFTLLVSMAMLNLCACASVVERHKNEEMAAGTEIADLPNIFGLTWQERRTRRFKLLSQTLVTKDPASSTDGDSWVYLDPESGKITLMKRNDREEMCGKALECIVRMQVVMLPQQYFTLLNIELYIDDTNDHTPRFPSTKMHVNISENTELNEIVNIDYIQAVDLDIGENAKLSYKITPNDFFDVVQSVDEAGTMHLQLIVKSKIDYEETPALMLKLVASDGGSPPRSDEINLQINTIDENDNAPVFDSVEYVFELKESDEAGSVIATLHATDKDSGLYGQVEYFLPDVVVVDETTALTRKLLAVNKATGDIILKQKLRRGDHDGLKVLIEARDKDPVKPRVGKVWIKLRVEDVNDNDPTISVNFIVDADNDTAFVPESEMRGVYIAYVSASDKDNGRNGETEISIRTSAINGRAIDSQFDQIDPHFVLEQGGLIGISNNLNRETINQYMLTITACDNGQPARCSEKIIKIMVLDVNDFAPQFPMRVKTINVLENGEGDVVIDTLQAIDGDDVNPPAMLLRNGKLLNSNYGEITYSIAKGDSRFFCIDDKTGELRLLQALDYEKMKKWELIVTARDGGGKHSKSSNITVIINVVDMNDNPPVFVNPVRNDTTVYATTLKDQLVMRIKAKDFDIGENSKLTYEILEVDGDKISGRRKTKSIFLLHPSNGALRLNFSNPNITDYLGPHKLVIQVTDSGEFPLRQAVRLTVQITDTDVAVPIGFEMDIKIIIIIGVISFVFLLLIVLLLCALITCHKRKKESHTYNCRNVESKASKVWITREDDQSTMYDSRSPSRAKAESIENENMKTSQVNMSRDNRNEYTSLMYDKEENGHVTSGDRGIAQGSMSTFSYEERKRKGLEVPVFPSTVDRDSGRGDSDPEMVPHDSPDSGATQDDNMNNGLCSSSDMAPRCNSACLEHGHSDSCWMPSPTRQNSIESPSILSYSRSSVCGTPVYPQYHQQLMNNNYQSTYSYVNSSDLRTDELSYDMPDYPPPPSIAHSNQTIEQRYTSPTYSSELNPISEVDDNVHFKNRYDVIDEDDDVSIHTQLALSTDVAQPYYMGSQNQLSGNFDGVASHSLNRNHPFHEPPHIQRTTHPHEQYGRSSSRLSSCSSNNSFSHRPRNTPHRSNPYKNVQLPPPYQRSNNYNYNNNAEASTLPRLHQEHVPNTQRHYASTDLLTEAPQMSSLESYYQNERMDHRIKENSGEVTLEETNDILKSIEKLLEKD